METGAGLVEIAAGERITHRNGYRLGWGRPAEIDLQVPRKRSASSRSA